MDTPPKLWMPPTPAIIRPAKIGHNGGPALATTPFCFFGRRQQPAYINQTNASISATNTVTFSHATIGMNALVVLIEVDDGNVAGAPSISSVTFDGAALDMVVTAVPSPALGFDQSSAIYAIMRPGPKTANVVVTLAANVTGRVQAVNVAGIQAAHTSGSDVTVTPLEVALVTTVPTIMFGAVAGRRAGAATVTWTSGVVEILDESPITNVTCAAGYRLSTAGESYTFGVTPSAAFAAGTIAVAAFR